jgi:hypothetical protein
MAKKSKTGTPKRKTTIASHVLDRFDDDLELGQQVYVVGVVDVDELGTARSRGSKLEKRKLVLRDAFIVRDEHHPTFLEFLSVCRRDANADLGVDVLPGLGPEVTVVDGVVLTDTERATLTGETPPPWPKYPNATVAGIRTYITSRRRDDGYRTLLEAVRTYESAQDKPRATVNDLVESELGKLAIEEARAASDDAAAEVGYIDEAEWDAAVEPEATT